MGRIVVVTIYVWILVAGYRGNAGKVSSGVQHTGTVFWALSSPSLESLVCWSLTSGQGKSDRTALFPEWTSKGGLRGRPSGPGKGLPRTLASLVPTC